MDHIKNLLSQTGWSCDDLLEKIREFKTSSTTTSPNKSQSDISINNSATTELIQNVPSSINNSDTLIQNVPSKPVHENGYPLNESDHTYTCINDDYSAICEDKESDSVSVKSELNDISESSSHAFESNDLDCLIGLKASDDNETSTATLEPVKDISVPPAGSDVEYSEFKRKKIPKCCKNNLLLRLKRSVKSRIFHRNKKRDFLIPNYKSTGGNENVRNKIMLQLELLRSRKTSDFSTDVAPTFTTDHVAPVACKKRYSNENSKNTIENNQNSMFCDNNCETDNGVYGNELPFDSVLVPNSCQMLNDDVQNSNSIDDYPQDPLQIKELSDELPKDNYEFCDVARHDVTTSPIKPTKTTDITKIKGWRHKRFLSAELEENNDSLKNVFNTKPISSLPSDTCDMITKSAFASSNLDGFLHDSANLHISFEIPTLELGSSVGTEKSPKIKKPAPLGNQNLKDDTNGLLMHDTQNLLKIQKIDNLYRPRTVGQKRRIWRLKRDTKLKSKFEENPSKPRTLAEKRRLLDQDHENDSHKQKMKKSNDENLKYSYILYRGRKIKVPTKTENGIVTYIKNVYGKKDYIYVPKRIKNNKKPSIFNNNCVVKSDIVRYRPGPLCKKETLQLENKNWKTILKKLPQIYLQVHPEVGKPIHPSLRHLLPTYDFELTSERIEFALSVVQNTDTKHFTFPVNYANSQEIALFREQTVKEDSKDILENDSMVTDTVKTMLGQMLDYIETKEISDEIFKEDASTRFHDEDVFVDKEPVQKRKRKIKHSKTNYELKRLNVKVIEVDLEEEKDEDAVKCNKDFCKLGCVCKSLATTSSLVSNHCGVPECMFECTCNYNKNSKGNLKVTLPIGTDLLSEGAVSRLEVEAKRNLAKVEKEFTQTVIQANNQTIVVGGCTNRQRRATKLPKKYNDFVDDPDDLLNNQDVNETKEEEKVEINAKDIDWKPCVVNITHLKLEQLVPYCLVHNLHDCHCKYKAEYKPTKSKRENHEKKMEGVDAEDEFVDPRTDKATCARTKGISTDYYLIRNRTQHFVSTRKKILDKKYKSYVDNLMNEEVHYLDIDSMEQKNYDQSKNSNTKIEEGNPKKSRRKQQLTFRQDNINDVRDLHKLSAPKVENAIQRRKYKIYTKNFANDSNNPIIDDEGDTDDLDVEFEVPPNETSRRMNTSEIINVETTGSEGSQNSSNGVNESKTDEVRKLGDLLEHETNKPVNDLLTPSMAVRQKFLQLLGKNDDCRAQFRLMLWSCLAMKFETGQMHLWYSSYFKTPKIIVTGRLLQQKHFTNIKSFETIEDKSLIQVDFIRWLVTKTVPGNKIGKDVLVILQLTKTHCEVCGICEKKSIASQSSENMLLSLIPSSITEKTIENGTAIDSAPLKPLKKKPHGLDLFSHLNKNLYNVTKKIMYSKTKFLEQTLIDETMDCESGIFNSKFLIANLPSINRASMWRMIQLNSDFSVLGLQRNKYAIKYSDLLKLVNMAKTTGLTVLLKTRELDTNYPHSEFGIYASPNCDDKIFIGPYYCYENHDISGLRYVNHQLLETDIFNQMKGLNPVGIGVWLQQVQKEAPEKNNVQTIDLTEYDSDNEESTSETGNVEQTVKLKPSSRSLLKKPVDASLPIGDVLIDSLRKSLDETKVFNQNDINELEMSIGKCRILHSVYSKKSCKEITEDVTFKNNLYFITNVPTMGYILAHKVNDSILIRWPSFKRGQQFHDIKDAISSLEREFEHMFIVLPNFEIKFKCTDNVSPTLDNLFDEKYLHGYYVASRYGITPLLNITKHTMDVLSTTKYQLFKRAKLRARKILSDMCYNEALKLYPTDIPNIDTCNKVLKMMNHEIKLREREAHYLNVKRGRLLMQKNDLIKQFGSVITELSPLVHNKTRAVMMDILNRHKTTNESAADKNIVCINLDSDEETTTNAKDNVNISPKAATSTSQLHPEKTNVEPDNNNKIVDIETNISKTCISVLKNKDKIPSNLEKVTVIPVTKINDNIFKLMTPKTMQNIKMASKRSFLIKTQNGKYMAVKAGNVKRLSPPKLIPTNNPAVQIKKNVSLLQKQVSDASHKSLSIVSNLSVHKPTARNRLLLPAKNQFVRVGYNETTSKVTSVQPLKIGDQSPDVYVTVSASSSDPKQC